MHKQYQPSKIKNQGKRKDSKPARPRARRVMTAKLKNELAQQKRGGSSVTEQPRDSSATTEAVDQAEQTTGAAVHESGHQVKRGVSRAVTKAKKEQKKMKVRQSRPQEPATGGDIRSPEIPEQYATVPLETDAKVSSGSSLPRMSPGSIPRQALTPPDRTPAPKVRPEGFQDRAVSPKVRPVNTSSKPVVSKDRTDAAPIFPKTRPTDAPVRQTEPKTRPISSSAAVKGQTAERTASPSPPSPGDRMLQQVVDHRRELTRHPERPVTTLAGSSQPIQEHYGKSTATSGVPTTPKENLSPKNQSINPFIKERPRRSFHLKEKPPGGTFTPRPQGSMGQAVKSAVSSANISVPSGKKYAAKNIMERAKRKVQKEAQRNIFQKSKQTAKTAAKSSKKAVLATTKAAKALIGALSAFMGGSVLIAALCVIFLVAAVIASPFGILFANEPSPGAVPLNAAVSQINMELTDKLALLQAGAYDSIDIQGTGPDWREVAAVFACKTAMGTDGVDVAALTPDRVDRLKAVFWDMCAISTSVETIDHPATGGTAAWTENILHITITAKTADDMRTVYPFNNEQNRALTELLAELDMIGNLLGDLSVSQDDATELLRRLPKDLSPERRAVVETACKLVGKVNYFWGGKSRVIGWDSRWGTIQKVGAAGNSTSGTYRPFGLDCSGFVDWVFYNISGGSYVLGHGGGAHAQHIYCTPITWAEAQPGDLVFYPDDTHVGIVGGRDKSGNIQIVHCASNYNNVVITGKAGFATIGRPQYYIIKNEISRWDANLIENRGLSVSPLETSAWDYQTCTASD